MLEKIKAIFDECEDEKMKVFEDCVKTQSLMVWYKRADELELKAYQQIKMVLRGEL